MRIVAGTLGGRRLSAPPGVDTRPTSDRVREALFSTLATIDAIEDATVLDAFAGSGALAFEAISRGARSAVCVERGRVPLATLRANREALHVEDSVAILHGDVFALAARGGLRGGPFSLLFLDPPYRLDKFKVRGLIESLQASGLLTACATVVWEHATEVAPDWPMGFSVVREKRYGDTSVSIATGPIAEEVR